MRDDSDRFISGIYNYCDRWCERCRFTDRCMVFEREQKQWERRLLRGEDPHSGVVCDEQPRDHTEWLQARDLQRLSSGASARGYLFDDQQLIV